MSFHPTGMSCFDATADAPIPSGDRGSALFRWLRQCSALPVVSRTPDASKGSSFAAQGSALTSDWLTLPRFALILGVLILAAFPEVVFGGKSFYFRDFGMFTYPAAYFQRECFWRGEFPLWNPYSNCGIPFLAQWNTCALYPLSLTYLLLPLTGGLTVFFLGHLFFAGIGMYLLAFRWTEHRLAAAIAGVAFVFNGLTLNCLMWASNLAALAWMPFVVLALEHTWERKKWAFLIAAAVGTFQMLTGSPEVIVITWGIAFLLGAARVLNAWHDLPRMLLCSAGLVILISLLSAVQLLPFAELLSHSERSSGLRVNHWPIPSTGWANFFLPLYHCLPSAAGVYFQPGQDWTSSYFPGIAVLAFASVAALTARTPRVWVLWGVAIVGFVLATGEKALFYSVFLKVFPWLGFMRYPIKFALVLPFCLALLASFGVVSLSRLASENYKKTRTVLVNSSVALLCIIGGLVLYSFLKPFAFEKFGVVALNGLERGIFLMLAIALALLCWRLELPRARRAAEVGLLVVLWADVITHVPRQNPTVDPFVYQPGLVRKYRPDVPSLGESRPFLTKDAHDLLYTRILPKPEPDYVGRRLAPMENCNMLDQIPLADGFYSLYVREQREITMRLLLAEGNQFPNGLADFLAIAYVSNPTNVSQWQPRPSPLKFATIGQQPIFTNESSIPPLLMAGDFDPRARVYLPEQAAAEFGMIGKSQGSITNAAFSPQHVRMSVTADAAALVVISQTYYPGWRAYVDGKPTELLRANYAFQAVRVPGGHHDIRLSYKPTTFRIGLFVSGLTLLACVAAALYLRSRKAEPSAVAMT